MIYKGIELNTFEKVFEKALEIPNSEAEEFFTVYVRSIMDAGEIGIEQATHVAKSNLGYYAGYYSNKVRRIIEKKYRCVHPILGSVDEPISNLMAFNLGRNGITHLFEQPK